jgi:hypothetical protein
MGGKKFLPAIFLGDSWRNAAEANIGLIIAKLVL